MQQNKGKQFWRRIYDKTLRLDMFGKQLKINFGGKDRVHTGPGLLMTLAIFVLMIIYTSQRLTQLINFKNPNITIVTTKNYYNYQQRLDLKDLGFKIAFALVDQMTNKPLDDDSVALFDVVPQTFLNLRPTTHKPIKFKKCNDSDYDSFYPPSDKESFEDFKQNKTLYCLEDYDNLYLRGKGQLNADVLSIRFIPCSDRSNSKQTKTCKNQTIQEINNFLINPTLVLFMNNQRINMSDFSTKSIIKESIFQYYKVDTSIARLIEVQLKSNLLVDQASFVNYGQLSETEFFSYNLPQEPSVSFRKNFPDYNIIAFQLSRSLDLDETNRQTYDLLQFLGDVGGLGSILQTIGLILVSWISSFEADSYLVKKVFTQSNKTQDQTLGLKPILKYLQKLTSQLDSQSQQKIKKYLTDDFSSRTKIQVLTFAQSVLCCLRGRNLSEKKKLKRGVKKANRELDILRLLKRVRLIQKQSACLLDKSQRVFSRHLSQRILNEHSSTDNESSFESPHEQKYEFLDKIVAKSNKNRRLLKAYFSQELRKEQQNQELVQRLKEITLFQQTFTASELWQTSIPQISKTIEIESFSDNV